MIYSLVVLNLFNSKAPYCPTQYLNWKTWLNGFGRVSTEGADAELESSCLRGK